MANERDEKFEGQEESEYHFSDDQATYEIDTETAKASEAAVTVKRSPMEFFKKYRRMIIAVVVFFILMFIVYEMLTPATSSTEFSPAVSSKPKTVTTTIKTTTPAAQPAAAPVTMPQSPTPQQPVMTMPQTSSPPPAVAQQQTYPPGVAPGGMPIEATPSDRIAALEQQNAKLANLLQIEYAQKMADYAAQASATQAKIQDLSKRVANMEATLNQITQILQDGKPAPTPGIPAARATEPKQVYVVQAIIPGRAWLKSDAGDTITVAEGDILKDYGKVTKIDPYNGVVEIDTGSRIISLSYGSSND